MPKSINIAVDGYSSTGKSTLAKDLAAALGYRYIDSGAMYRGVTLYALKNGLIKNGRIAENLADYLEDMHLEFIFNRERGASDLHLNGEDVEEEIRELEVAKYVSDVAAISAVRKFLVKAQQKMAAKKEVVMDGRDIGTVVMPDAELKIFVTARQAVRTARRHGELIRRGKDVTKQEVEANLMQRDLIDSTREDSPLTQAGDARLLDNSELSLKEQLEIGLKWAKEVLKN